MDKKIKEKTSNPVRDLSLNGANGLEEKKIYTKPGFIIAVVVILVILGISLAYAINQSALNEEKQAKIDELQKKVNNLTNYIESLQVNGNQTANQQETQVQSKIGAWPEYTNETFGFSLSFPETWEGYLITENANFIDFGFTEQNPVARISIIGPEQWEQVRQQEDNGLLYVGETEEYVIVYSLVAQAVDENIQALITEFPTIIENLTLLEGELIVKDYSLEDGEAVDEEEVDEEEVENFTYSNEEYGFGLVFPGTWQDYAVSKSIFDLGEIGEATAINFNLADTNLFSIFVLDIAEWEGIQENEEYNFNFLWDTDEEVFVYSQNTTDLTEDLDARAAEITEIISSFNINE